MPTRFLVPLLTALLLFPATARADWIPAAPIDGPHADPVTVGNVDLARDGVGAVAYLRNEGGVRHAFVARLFGGTWRGPERIDPTPTEATEVQVAAGDGNRLVVAWITDGHVYAQLAPGGTPEPGAFTGHVLIGGPDAKSLDIDMGVNGAAYATWEQGGNVHTARLQDTTWTGVPQPLDIDPAVEAGTGALRPRVAVSAEGYAVITWGDVGPGYTRVWARRVTGLNLSVAPQLLNLDGGGSADSPDIDIEEDGSFAWVVYRQDLGGVSRTVGRRLIGSQFEAPEFVDGGLSATDPKVDINGDGIGVSASAANGATLPVGAWLTKDHFQPGGVLGGGSATATKPEVSSSDRGDLGVAWRTGDIARARYKDDEGTAFGPEFTISNPGLGPVNDPGVMIGGDRLGDFAVAMVQGSPGGYTLTGALYDRSPGIPFIESNQRYKRKTRPELRWRPGLDLWGPQRYRVLIDGQPVAETTVDVYTPRVPLTTGKHTWQIESVDMRGQSSKSRLRTLKIDATAPTLKVKVSGRRVAGQSLKIAVRAKDAGGSGLDRISVDYGDKTEKADKPTTRHRYKRGTFRLKVWAYDRAGNVTRKQVKLRIKRS